MANGKYYHVYLRPKTGIDMETVNSKMDLALDWFSYDKYNWVLFSSSSMERLMTRFKPLAEPGGRLFICELNMASRNGLMNKDFWEWLRNTKNK